MLNRDFYNKYFNYILIGLVSLIALVFLPFVGSEAGLEVKLPNTTAGWIVFVLTKVIVAVINVLIFHCFIQQAEVNVKEHEKYKEATRILDLVKVKEIKYLSPQEFYRKEYGQKGVSIAITSILSAFGLAQAILTWDALTFLTYLFTVVMGLIFGCLEMTKVESYLTTDLWHYATKVAQGVNKAVQGVEQSEGTLIKDDNLTPVKLKETKENLSGN